MVVDAAEIRDHETDLVSWPFLWFQSRQIFRETHETEAKPFLPSLSSKSFAYQDATCHKNYFGFQMHCYSKIGALK